MPPIVTPLWREAMRVHRRLPRNLVDPWLKLFGIAAAAATFMFAVVWVGFGVIGPAPVIDVAELIEIDGGATPAGGRFLVTAVERRRADPVTLIRAKLDDAMDQRTWFEDDPTIAAAGEIEMEQATSNALRASTSYLGSTPGVRLMPIEGVPGGSGGLMMALGVVDALTAEDLTQGRVIAGTGAISPTGEVGAIRGLKFKVAAAERAAAEIFLVPAAQAEEARVAAARMDVIGVSTLAEAVAVLKG